MKTRWHLLLLCSLVAYQASAQSNAFVIKGTVSSGAESESLPGAHVFLANTTYGTISDAEGKFALTVDQPGQYDLIVSFLGYSSYARQINLTTPTTIELAISLTAKEQDLGSVTVKAISKGDWRRYLKLFKEIFLGSSMNAKRTILLNQQALGFYFDEETQTLSATAEEPLLLRNKELGYDIEYYLEEFEVSFSQQYSRYAGYPLFKDLEAGQGITNRIRKNRQKAYLGSIEHFFKAVYENRVFEEGFVVQAARDTVHSGLIISADTVAFPPTQNPNDAPYRKLGFDEYLFITYTKAFETQAYQEYTAMIMLNDRPQRTGGRNPQRSWIRLNNPKKPILFNASGHILNALSFVEYGFWGFQKLADRVPLDYRLPAGDG